MFSSDGAIKVWEEAKVLLTEVMLEDSLSAATFLNDMGDLLVGFKNQIFYIDHTKCKHPNVLNLKAFNKSTLCQSNKINQPAMRCDC